jgi:hypothetical protein
MTEEKPKMLFTPKYKDLIKRARELNTDRRISGDIYFHPRESGNKVVVKTIDLNLVNPLCEVNSRPHEKSKAQNKKDWEERWVEAYLINKAKKKSWVFDNLAGKDYRFLASQLTFRESSALKIEDRYHKHIDLLLYNQDDKHLVVLELKSEANKSSLSEANQELKIYVKELLRLLKDEKTKEGKNAVLEAFELESVEDVIGYIVYPRAEKELPIKKEDFPNYEPFGLIEYSKPWGDNFGEVTMAGKSMEINFTLRKTFGNTTEVEY